MGSTNNDMRPRPRCDVCNRVIRVNGIGTTEVWCSRCLVENIPFIGIESEGNYRAALMEFREGLGSGGFGFKGARFDPFGEEERMTLKSLDQTLRGCRYTKGDETAKRLRELGIKASCFLSLLFHNIRSARGPGLELLESEIRSWGVNWDVIGLAETWLDKVSENYFSVKG